MNTKWRVRAVALATTILFAACAATASADVTMSTPGTTTDTATTVAADGGTTTETDTLVDTALDPGIVNDAFTPHWRCRTIQTTRTRHGVTGGLLWQFERNRHWCYNGIRIKNVSTTYSGTKGSGTWEWTGIIANNYNESGCPTTSCWYYGSTTKGLMTSLIPIPFTTITEHNKPWIRQTVFSDGHATTTTNCGC